MGVYVRKILVEGETVVLTCAIAGYPAVSCMWLFNNIAQSDNCSDWRIESVRRLDAGTYSCVAENLFAKKTSSPEFIQVHCKYLKLLGNSYT